MKKTIQIGLITIVILFLVSGIGLSTNDNWPPEVPPDADVQTGEVLVEIKDIVTKEIHITIERIHQEIAGIGEEIEITLRMSNQDDEDVDIVVSEFHIQEVGYLDPIETKTIYYQALEKHYYLWSLFLPAYGSEEIKYHIKSDFPRVITFPSAHVTDHYGNHFDSMPTIIVLECIIDGVCSPGESVLNCPEDCPTGAQDDVCDAVADGINDPDCSYGTDPDYDPEADTDGDRVPDKDDICSGYPETDSDFDGKPDDCDRCPNDPDNDVDNDAICGDVDNCPTVANADQADSDNDGLGDICDTCPNDANNDTDGDGVCGDVDNCPNNSNPDQTDKDGDGIGDACKPSLWLDHYLSGFIPLTTSYSWALSGIHLPLGYSFNPYSTLGYNYPLYNQNLLFSNSWNLGNSWNSYNVYYPLDLRINHYYPWGEGTLLANPYISPFIRDCIITGMLLPLPSNL